MGGNEEYGFEFEGHLGGFFRKEWLVLEIRKHNQGCWLAEGLGGRIMNESCDGEMWMKYVMGRE